VRIGLSGIFVDDQDQAEDAQQLYVVPASDLVLGRLGRDVDDRHWPELLSDLARRLDEASSGRASMTLDSVLHQRRRPLASASDRPSTTRGSRGRKPPQRGR
jgi:hypothetical protein